VKALPPGKAWTFETRSIERTGVGTGRRI
jgi:hypothetical protein